MNKMPLRGLLLLPSVAPVAIHGDAAAKSISVPTMGLRFGISHSATSHRDLPRNYLGSMPAK
jgi:hypothetical protein